MQLFEYSFNCDTGLVCSDTGYDNDVDTPLPVAAYVDFGSGFFGAGGVVMTSDSDMFSNDGLAPGNGNTLFATNIFKWIGTAQTGPPSVTKTGFTAITPTRIYDTRLGFCAPVEGGGRDDA